ncbi:MAG TPA: porin [Tepidisphaeraceae bacterium]|nr:porin [Tepidisphaeraceae bacterium]
MTRKTLFTAGVLASALGLGAGSARAAEPTTEQLMQQIQQLQSKVEQLEAKQSPALSAQQVDKTVERVIQDADRRSQLLQMEGFTAGWTKDKGFRIQDAQGNWALQPLLEFQFRSDSNWRNDGKHGGSDQDTENGFDVRRMALGFTGNAFTPNLTYFFMWNSGDSSLGLEQAWVKYFFNDDWALRAGQIRNPVFHEQAIGPTHQLAADRSLVNLLITGADEAFTQAITLQYDSKDSPIWAEIGLEDGFQSGGTNFLDPNEGGNTDWGVFGRVNYFIKGDHKAYGDFTAMGNRDDLMVIGGGGDITQVGDVTFYLHTVDFQWENSGGLGIYAAFLGDYIDNQGTDDTFYNWGVLVQAGYMINDRWEVFGRYDYTHFDSDLVSSGESEEYCELTAGVNWYVGGGHNAKVTLDLTYLPNGSPTDDTDLGILTGGDTQLLARAQFQLLL